jgi:hypothetical protein
MRPKMNTIRCMLDRFRDGLKVGQAWQIAAAWVLLFVLSGVTSPVRAQASGRLLASATVVPATAAWEAQDGVKAFLQQYPSRGVVKTALATIVSESTAASPTSRELDPPRILTVNYLAN